MRDAYGGIVNITMIVVFLVIVSGYLAFNVTYTKAFRMKNKVISTLEEYEGNCQTACQKEMDDYSKSIGYNVKQQHVSGSGGTCSPRGYCWTKHNASGNSSDLNKVYFTVTTKIVIEIPIIRNIMEGTNIFNLSGNTKLLIPRS